MPTYPDVQTAFLAELDNLLVNGKVMPSRLGDSTLEVIHRSFTIQDPAKALIHTPHRNNNIFAALAETMWVLGGRNDIAFLSKYLPRAAEYSDDGITWRGAYGPRLRNWNGIDQLAEIVKILEKSPTSRRAVAMIYDPDRDFVASKDIPCNDALHFCIRDGRLHLLVFTRSNDIMWGWSGINSFEWSVLQRVLAGILGVGIGQITFTIGSLHLYDRHITRAKKILEAGVPSIYTKGTLPFTTDFRSIEMLDGALQVFFKREELHVPAEAPLDFVGVVQNLLLYHATDCSSYIDRMPNWDIVQVAREYMEKKYA